MELKKLLLLILIMLSSGCATVQVIDKGKKSDHISTFSLTCKKPYIFTQDCSNWWGANRTITIEQYDVKIAGSCNGNIILVMDAHLLKNTFLSNPFLLNAPRHSHAVNNSFEAVQKVLRESKIEILKVVPVKAMGNIDGYVLETDGDGYSILTTYSKG